MLRIKVNNADGVVRYEPVNGELFVRGSDIVLITPTKTYSVGDSIYFERTDGNEIHWAYTSLVKSVDPWTGGGYIYTFAGLPEVMLNVLSAETRNIVIKQGSEAEKVLILYLNEEHNYIKNRDKEPVGNDYESVFVSGHIGCTSYGVPITDVDHGCAGDYVSFNNYFLYKVLSTESDGKYVMNGAVLKNYTTNVWYYDGDNKVYFDAIVPCTLGGRDMRDMIILRGEGAELENIADSLLSYTFYGKDERFFTEGSESGGFKNTVFKQGASVSWRLGDIRISIPAAQDFATDAFQEEAISQYIGDASNQYINHIIDYEKQQFIPVYDGKDASKIVFRITLRQRDEDWNTNDNLGWYGDDSIYNLGFDDDDIYYRKKKVTETFLRVSIYNNTSRASQKLLYTAKIYLNAGDLYGKYVDGLEEEMNTEFVCTHKYDYYNSTEGFYFHLFPSNLGNNDTGTVYMKCELNNAKYGVTVPLVRMTKIDGACNHRSGYIINENGEYRVDMAALTDDMYIPVKIDKDEDNDRYIWEFDTDCIDWEDEDASNTLTVHLFEPRINHE